MEITTDNNLLLILDREHLKVTRVGENQYLAVLRCIDLGFNGDDREGNIKSYMGIIEEKDDYLGMKNIMHRGEKTSELKFLSRWIEEML